MEKALIISLIALGVITTFLILCCIKAGKDDYKNDSEASESGKEESNE